jgi:uncharacterized protein (TIGR03435 family)
MLCEPFGLNEVIPSDRSLEKGIHEMTARRFVQTSYPYLSASAVLVLTGLANPPQTRAQSPGAAGAHPQFEVASIKPNTSASGTMKFPFPSGGRFTATNLNLKILISFAYKVQGFEVSGGPGGANSGWIGSDRYDVTAKAADSNIGAEQYRLMLQALLADRFKLAVHRETKEMPVYALLPGKGGPRLPEADPKGCVTSGQNSAPPQPGLTGPLYGGLSQSALPACGGFFTGPSSLDGRKMAMPQFVDALSIVLGRRVIDKTGFTGTFDIHLEFSPEGTALDRRGSGDVGLPVNTGNPDTSRPSIFTAVQEQLGLKLESQKAPAEVLVIDHVERVPTEN